MRLNSAWLPILLGFLQAVGPISTDMYLPAFPAIEASFHAPDGSAQITLGSWVLGLALGQIIQGSLSDRFGRRGPLLVGTVVYTAGSVGCALSGSIGVMSAWRFMAAVGASASMVIPRAIVRDISEGHEAARLISRLILVLGAAPILAPTLGGAVLQIGSWRTIFWINAFYGALALLAASWKLPDTLPAAARIGIHPYATLMRYRHILAERGFITHVLMMSCYAFALFAYLGGSPSVFIDHYHFTPGQYALVFGGVAALYILCSQLNMKLVRRFDLDGTLHRVSWLYLVLAMTMLTLALVNAAATWFIAVLALTHGLNGFLSPTATVGALRHHGAQAGSASALMGMMQFGIGASGGFVVGWLTNGTAVPMAGLMLAAGAAAKLADLCRPRAERVSALLAG
jgi:DHA1 family bicyclomycin/chloramphenicol resistance-like MFS transporter